MPVRSLRILRLLRLVFVCTYLEQTPFRGKRVHSTIIFRSGQVHAGVVVGIIVEVQQTNKEAGNFVTADCYSVMVAVSLRRGASGRHSLGSLAILNESSETRYNGSVIMSYLVNVKCLSRHFVFFTKHLPTYSRIRPIDLASLLDSLQ
jgi:hypothetical protein